MECSRSLFRLTAKITRLPPSDCGFRKRSIGNSGAFFGSSTFPVRPERLGGFLLMFIVVQQHRVKSTFELSVLIPESFEHHADMKETHW